MKFLLYFAGNPKCLMLRTVLLLTSLPLLWSAGRAQNQPLYTYQQLSNTHFAVLKDSLKKAWACPEVSSDRSVQRKYREIWEERTSFLATAIEKQHFIYDAELHHYLQNIIDQIVAANSRRFSARPLLLIDRSAVANAYAMGSNVLVVNLGLIRHCRTFANLYVQDRERFGGGVYRQ